MCPREPLIARFMQFGPLVGTVRCLTTHMGPQTTRRAANLQGAADHLAVPGRFASELSRKKKLSISETSLRISASTTPRCRARPLPSQTSFAAPYMTIPTVLPITAPTTGTGMSVWPTIDETALTDASRQAICDSLMSSCSVSSPARYRCTRSATLNEAVTTELATAAGVAVKFVST